MGPDPRRRPRLVRRSLGVAAALVVLGWVGPAGALASHALLGRTASQLRAEGWDLRRCGDFTCAGPVVEGGPFGRGREVYGIWFAHGHAVVQYDLRLARAESVATARRLVLAHAPPGSTLSPFRVSYAPGQDVDVATGASPTLAAWLGAVDPKGRFCAYLATAPSGRFVASDVRHVLVAAWVKGAAYGGC